MPPTVKQAFAFVIVITPALVWVMIPVSIPIGGPSGCREMVRYTN